MDLEDHLSIRVHESLKQSTSVIPPRVAPSDVGLEVFSPRSCLIVDCYRRADQSLDTSHKAPNEVPSDP
jgi:hypothetical protein